MHPTALHLLLPFALSAEIDFATETVAQSAYAQLLRRATLIERHSGTAFQRVLPYESWLANCFGVTSSATEIEQAPLAPYMLLAEGGLPGAALWSCVQPVHLQIAQDHLVLNNPATLALTHDEAISLLEAAKPTFTAFNLTLAAPTPCHWYLSGEALGEWLSTAPLRATGRNIEIWLPAYKNLASPSTSRTRAWLKLQNEVQMVWFDHPVNQAREAKGQPTVNSIWLYAQGTLQPVTSPFTHLFSNAAATRGLGLAAQAQVASLPHSFAELDSMLKTLTPTTIRLKSQTAWPNTLVELDHFIQPFIQQDSLAQHEAFAALERSWFAPALQALKSGTLPSVTLTLCGETEHITLQITRADLRKFWRRRALASLLH